jgi:hypothetical protein
MKWLLWNGHYTSKYGLAMAQHISSVFPYNPTGYRRRLLQGSSTTILLISRVLWVVLMHGPEACMRSLSWCAHLPIPK